MSDRLGVAWWKVGEAPAPAEDRDEACRTLIADVSIEIAAEGDATVWVRVRAHWASADHAMPERSARISVYR